MKAIFYKAYRDIFYIEMSKYTLNIKINRYFNIPDYQEFDTCIGSYIQL